jgi:hypothetical protein
MTTDIHYRLFFKRTPDSFSGIVSFVKYTYDSETGKTTPEYILDKVKARSGQRAYAGTDNVLGKSPIPYGDWILHADKEEQLLQKPGPRGIGWAFHVSSQKDNFLKLYYKRLTRTAIMIHAENGLPGSAGCIVLLNWSDMVKLGNECHKIHREFKDTPDKIKIRLTVMK